MNLDKEKFRFSLGTWFPKFEPLFDNGTMDKIYGTLKEQGQRMSIAPLPSDTFKAFEKCKLSNLSCVFLGLAPYASYWYGKPVSDGLAFSCSIPNGYKNNEQPSLRLIWDSVFDDLGKKGKRWNDLSFWAHQGVLLLNVALTAKKDKPDSHIELWEPFIRYMFEEILSQKPGLPIVYFGKKAARFKSFTLPLGHYNKIVEHPAFSARQDRPFEHEGLYTWVNKLLEDQGKEPIEWIVDEDRHKEILKDQEIPF